MNQVLLIGDPHAKPDSIEEVRSLMKWAIGYAVDNKIEQICLMGDLYDTHGVARLEVQRLWTEVFNQCLEAGVRVSLLSGNHDMDYECRWSWLEAHEPYCDLVATMPMVHPAFGLATSVAAIPYVRSSSEFIKLANKAAADGYKFVLCHQEFKGCQLDNGFYSPHGAEVAQLPAGVVFISGHIHKRQVMMGLSGTPAVVYVGAPRPMTRCDVGKIPTVTVFDYTKGKMTTIDVPETVVPRMVHFELRAGQDFFESKVPSRTYVDIYGSKDFIREQLRRIPTGVKTRTFPESNAVKSTVKESEGIKVAFSKYFGGYIQAHGLSEDKASSVLKKIDAVWSGLKV